MRGEALPDCVTVELGEGYRLEGSMAAEAVSAQDGSGSEGDLERIERVLDLGLELREGVPLR